MVGAFTVAQAIVESLLDLVSVPAYVTDRYNRVRAVNRQYSHLVGDPISDGLRGDDLFIINLILGRYRSSYPRRYVEVAGCSPSLPGEIENGRLVPQAEALWRKALALDEVAARRVRDVAEGHTSARWNGLVVFKLENGGHAELQETVVPLVNLGIANSGPAYLNLWVDPSGGRRRDDDLLAALTTREREIAALYALGYSSREVAEIASISPHTARDHRDNIYSKLGIHSRAELALILLPHSAR